MRFTPLFLLLLAPLLFGAIVPPKSKTSPTTRQGKDFALFFPVSSYRHPNLTDLKQSVTNATAIAEELETSFGFKTEIVPNATYDQIVAKLQEYHQQFANGQLPADGQLFIYFSSHGMREFNSGYFLPADANPKSLFNSALGYDYWRPFISSINCQHIMVAVDACYSVTFDPDHTYANYDKYKRKGELTEAERILVNHEKYRSRIFFTSDSKEDKTPGRSDFARKLLEGLLDLRSPDGFVTSSILFSNYVERAQPPPRAGDFEGDDPSATFLFFHQTLSDLEGERNDLDDWQIAEAQNDCSAYRIYLSKHPNGDFARRARQKMAPCETEAKMLAAWREAKIKNDCDSYFQFIEEYPQSPYANQVKDILISLNCGSASVPSNMILIPNGTFQMGDPFGVGHFDENPVHAVTISQFFLSRTELTNRQFAEFLNSQGNQQQARAQWYDIKKMSAAIEQNEQSFYPKKGKGDYPVVGVSWYGAIAYCNWLSTQQGLNPVYRVNGATVIPDWSADDYRLPTEAEWEYAARSGGKKEKWAGTSSPKQLIKFVNFSGYRDGYNRIAPVGKLSPNSLGLVDMSGNVGEWCWDWYKINYYRKSPSSNPHGSESGANRIIRSGCWSDSPAKCRTTSRGHDVPSHRSNYVGFRLARSF